MDGIVPGLNCECIGPSTCYWSSICVYGTQQRCHLWTAVRVALDRGLWSFSIDAGQTTAVARYQFSYQKCFSDLVKGETSNMLTEQLLYNDMKVCVPYHRHQEKTTVAGISDSCTIYPTIIETLSVHAHQSVTFKLVEGRVIFGRRYYVEIRPQNLFKNDQRQFAPYDRTTSNLLPPGYGRTAPW